MRPLAAWSITGSASWAMRRVTSMKRAKVSAVEERQERGGADGGEARLDHHQRADEAYGAGGEAVGADLLAERRSGRGGAG